MSSPAFQFYPADYLADENVAMMTLEEEGAYVRAMCYCWREGSIPADTEKLTRLIGKGGSTTVTRVVQGCFHQMLNDPSRLVHPRLEIEREKQVDWARKSSIGGKRSVLARRKAAKALIESHVVQDEGCLNGGSMVVQPPSNSLSSSSSLSSLKTPVVPTGDEPKKVRKIRFEFPPEVEEIYEAYPRKVAALAAKRAIMAQGKTTPYAEILSATFLFAKLWEGADLQFCPYPATWFNGRRFLDPLILQGPSGKPKPVEKDYHDQCFANCTPK